MMNRRTFLTLLTGFYGALTACGRVSNTSASSTEGLQASDVLLDKTNACVVQPEMTEGPFFVDTQLKRSDIRHDTHTNNISVGVPLYLQLQILKIATAGCQALKDAVVDIWHCDASGEYSGVNSGMQATNTQQNNFLRGLQISNADGFVNFVTIYPGWYQGRAIHIHFKIRAKDNQDQAYEFTSQLFFDDALSDQLMTQAAYQRDKERDTRNLNDRIFQEGGSGLMLNPSKTSDGYSAKFSIALDLSNAQVGAKDGFDMPAGRPPPPNAKP